MSPEAVHLPPVPDLPARPLAETIEALRQLLPPGARLDLTLPPGPASLQAVIGMGGAPYSVCHGAVSSDCAMAHLNRVTAHASVTRPSTEEERAHLDAAAPPPKRCALVEAPKREPKASP